MKGFWTFLALAACSVRPEAPPPATPAPERAPAAAGTPAREPAESARLPSAAAPAEPPAAEPRRSLRVGPLAVPGFLDAVLVAPEPSRGLPFLVATHGAGGDPEWTCSAWAARTRGEAVVLCPRGRAISQREPHGYYYPDHVALGAEVLAAVAAAEQALGPGATQPALLYTGYSQGATMGVLFIADHAARFPRLVLTEGGFDGWTAAHAKKYAAGGGQRVLFVCGGAGCRSRAERSAAVLEAAGVRARVDHVPGGGHTDGGAVGQHLDAAYRWVYGEDG